MPGRSDIRGLTTNCKIDDRSHILATVTDAMSEPGHILTIVDADPPSQPWVLSTGNEFIWFNEIETATSEGLRIAKTVLVRIDGLFFWMGQWTNEVAMYGDEIAEGPPPRELLRSRQERYEMDRERLAREDEAAASYGSIRDDWLLENGLDSVIFECQILHPRCGWRQGYDDPAEFIFFEEFGLEGSPCGARLHGRSDASFGTPDEVLTAMAGSRHFSEWVLRTRAALDRERRWCDDPQIGTSARRWLLEVYPLRGELFHVSSSVNRESIHQHGLDWRLMGAASGVAGSTRFELPAVFLDESFHGAEWFVDMARFPVDIWAVESGGLWGENGPDGWVIVPEPISPDRVRLAGQDRVGRRAQEGSERTRRKRK
jgi:hypothetical protein